MGLIGRLLQRIAFGSRGKELPFIVRAADEVPNMPGVRPRTPAPGSQEPVNVPSTSTDRLYDTAYYHRDSRRNAPPVVVIEAQNTPAIEARREQLMKLPQGSQGQKNPDVLKYDPTGLRVTMTASHGELAKALANVQPNHLPVPMWMMGHEAAMQQAAEQGMVGVAGRRTKWEMPERLHEAHW